MNTNSIRKSIQIIIPLGIAVLVILLTLTAVKGQATEALPTSSPLTETNNPVSWDGTLPNFDEVNPGERPLPDQERESGSSEAAAELKAIFGEDIPPGWQKMLASGAELPSMMKENLDSVSPEDWGGPDAFGYTFLDSDEPDGPDPTFEDISGIGTLVDFAGSSYYTATMPFNFPYYGIPYSQTVLYGDCLYCYYNYTHLAFGQQYPSGAIYWMDYIDRDSGSIYVYSDTISSPERFIIQYQDVLNYSYGTTTTSQVILYENGDILVRYASDFSWWDYYYGGYTYMPYLSSWYSYLQYTDNPRNDFAVQFYYPDGAWLWPPEQQVIKPAGEQAVYTFDLHNNTGSEDSFSLSLINNDWPTSIDPANTGLLADGQVVPVVVTVDIPPGAANGDSDDAIIEATSDISPTVYSDTATINTTAVCSPALTFSGRSDETYGDLDDIYDYGGQKFAYTRIYAYSQDNDTLDASVLGYNPIAPGWEMIAQQSYGSSGLLVDQVFIPPTYTQVHVQLNDQDNNDLIYYDYQFIVCREPGFAIDPSYQERLIPSGATTVYTQTVTNYMMAEDSFDLSVEGNLWNTTFWDGDTQIDSTGLLLDLETFIFTVKVEPPADVEVGDSDAATIYARSVTSPTIFDTASLSTAILTSPWVQSYMDYEISNYFYDPEEYLDIVRPGGIIPVNVTDDDAYQNGPPAVAAYPRENIISAWTGAGNYNDYGYYYYNIEYAAHDADGNQVIPVIQVSDNISATHVHL